MYVLSPNVEQISGPLVFILGRVYRLAPPAMSVLASLPDVSWGPEAPESLVVKRLLELGIIVPKNSIGSITPEKRVRHPLSIHVRMYSLALLKIFEHVGVCYRLRNAFQACVAMAVGIIVSVVMVVDIESTGGVGALMARVTPAEVVGAVVCIVLTMVIHESAHVSAARKVGCHVPRAGVGIYLTSIVFFVDLSPLTELRPRERRHADLAGMAANALVLTFIWSLMVINIVSVDFGSLIVLGHVSGMLFTLNPWIKSDGYWTLRDSFPGASFDPANWLAQPKGYLAHLKGADDTEGSVRLTRFHFACGVIWLLMTLSWTMMVFSSFVNQPEYSGDLIRRWLGTGATILVASVGVSAVAFAILKGSQWRVS